MDLDDPQSIAEEMEYYRDVLQCFVPSCKKYRRDYPNSLYLSIPKPLQATWCQALHMNCPKRNLYVCEEHINIEEDCYKSKSGNLRLKKTANLILTKTYDEIQMLDDESSLMEQPLENRKDLATMSKQSLQYGSMPDSKCDSSTQTQIIYSNKAVLVKPSVTCVACSANIKVSYITEKIMPSMPSSSTASRSTTPSLYEPSSPSSTSSTKETVKDGKNMSGRTHMLRIIKENPKMYLGLPRSYFWLINFLANQCKLRPLHVIITLFKLKLNDTIQRISHQFNFSQVTLHELLRICIPNLATYLQMFIYLPESITIKKTLPPVFKVRFANVQCILDCFEIQIEKPSDPVMQARTWSQYKSCNTLKYLIACCPNGFICYISKGYGGRISDKAITECSGFVDILPPGAVVLADRGFKGIETLLSQRHVKLLRPPSVSSQETPTKKEVIQTKIIASLRIHVERVIRRVREFAFLKPHSVINHNHVRYADEAVIIACALVNLQGDIIKIQ
ncbi:uncharacterized protein [Choristoneura fumiferana]|uniref:uncharacterized protein n=1 Tax=Choristoneura fumiferana TaxID=7141 RepID=UPI003D153A8E